MRLRKFLTPAVLPTLATASSDRPRVMQQQRLILSVSVCVTLVLVGVLVVVSGPFLQSQVRRCARQTVDKPAQNRKSA